MITTVLLRAGLALLLLTPCACRAELLFYQGLMKLTQLGDGGQSKQTYRVWVVLDQDTGNIAKLDYFSAAGLKVYSAEDYQGLQTSAVVGPGQRTNSVLTQAETSMNSSNQLSVTSLFLQGANARLGVKTGAIVSFPRTLDWSSRGVTPAKHPPLSDTWNETGVITFNGADSISSNNRGETLAQAEARLISDLEGRGYREFSFR